MAKRRPKEKAAPVRGEEDAQSLGIPRHARPGLVRAEYYKDSPAADPQGPASGVFRTLHGGSFKNFVWNIRVSIRNRNLPTFRSDNNGFRPVLTRPGPKDP